MEQPGECKLTSVYDVQSTGFFSSCVLHTKLYKGNFSLEDELRMIVIFDQILRFPIEHIKFIRLGSINSTLLLLKLLILIKHSHSAPDINSRCDQLINQPDKYEKPHEVPAFRVDHTVCNYILSPVKVYSFERILAPSEEPYFDHLIYCPVGELIKLMRHIRIMMLCMKDQ